MQMDYFELCVADANEAALAAFLADRSADLDDDTAESEILEDAEPFAIVFDMAYFSSGAVKERRVRLIRIEDGGGDVTLHAWCYLRSMYRRFKLSKIRSITCVVTGEVFDRPQDYFAECGIMTAETPEARAIRACLSELTVLAFLGRCDGLFHPEERTEVVKHVCYRADEPLDEDVIRRRIAAMAPDARAFRAAIKALEVDDVSRRALVRSIRAVIDADGIVHQREIDVGRKLLLALGVDV